MDSNSLAYVQLQEVQHYGWEHRLLGENEKIRISIGNLDFLLVNDAHFLL